MFDTSSEFLRGMIQKLGEKFGVLVGNLLDIDIGVEQHVRHFNERSDWMRDTTEALRKLAFDSPEGRYDLEYLNYDEVKELVGRAPIQLRAEDTHYWYFSPIDHPYIMRDILNMIGGTDQRGMVVMELGAGTGKRLAEWMKLGEIVMTEGEYPSPRMAGFCFKKAIGLDISGKAVEKMAKRGIGQGKKILSIQSSIEDWKDAPKGEVDLLFLSYFVDRDRNQIATFNSSIKCLKGGGIIVLEGLFPCVMEDSNGVLYGAANITKGKDAVEDIELVVTEFKQLGMALEKILVGRRLVYSMDGPEVLPSYTLVLKKM